MNGLRVRVIRGGPWYSYPGSLRSEDRGRDPPGIRCDYLGFRLIAEPKDPRGRVLRGGSWISYPMFLCSAGRGWDLPIYRFDFFGFRLIAESKS